MVELLVGATLSGAIMLAVLSSYLYLGRQLVRLTNQTRAMVRFVTMPTVTNRGCGRRRTISAVNSCAATAAAKTAPRTHHSRA